MAQAVSEQKNNEIRNRMALASLPIAGIRWKLGKKVRKFRSWIYTFSWREGSRRDMGVKEWVVWASQERQRLEKKGLGEPVVVVAASLGLRKASAPGTLRLMKRVDLSVIS